MFVRRSAADYVTLRRGRHSYGSAPLYIEGVRVSFLIEKPFFVAVGFVLEVEGVFALGELDGYWAVSSHMPLRCGGGWRSLGLRLRLPVG